MRLVVCRTVGAPFVEFKKEKTEEKCYSITNQLTIQHKRVSVQSVMVTLSNRSLFNEFNHLKIAIAAASLLSAIFSTAEQEEFQHANC